MRCGHLCPVFSIYAHNQIQKNVDFAYYLLGKVHHFLCIPRIITQKNDCISALCVIYFMRMEFRAERLGSTMYTIHDLYDLSHTLASQYLSQYTYPWEALKGIKELVITLGQSLGSEYRQITPQVWVHETASIAPTAYLGAPCIIGAESEVRHGAFIRGSALVGEHCVVGNSVELKNVILFDNVQVPHYNYVGDSILGYKAHMGAGAVTSNVKSDRSLVVIHGEVDIPTGIKKVGAMLGDHVEVGCNSVLNPGTVIGKNSNVYPLSSVRGTVPENSICKTGGVIVAKK